MKLNLLWDKLDSFINCKIRTASFIPIITASFHKDDLKGGNSLFQLNKASCSISKIPRNYLLNKHLFCCLTFNNATYRKLVHEYILSQNVP